METNSNPEPILIFSGTAMQAGFVKSLLENAEIEAFLIDEYIGTLKPWISAAGGVGAVRVFVSSLDFENARQIVNEYIENTKGNDA